MIRYPGPGDTLMGTRSSPEAPPGSQLVAGGWDHEHCEICKKKIGHGGEPEGYFGQPDAWVCGECYNSSVVPRCLAVRRSEGVPNGRAWQLPGDRPGRRGSPHGPGGWRAVGLRG